MNEKWRVSDQHKIHSKTHCDSEEITLCAFFISNIFIIISLFHESALQLWRRTSDGCEDQFASTVTWWYRHVADRRRVSPYGILSILCLTHCRVTVYGGEVGFEKWFKYYLFGRKNLLSFFSCYVKVFLVNLVKVKTNWDNFFKIVSSRRKKLITFAESHSSRKQNLIKFSLKEQRGVFDVIFKTKWIRIIFYVALSLFH